MKTRLVRPSRLAAFILSSAAFLPSCSKLVAQTPSSSYHVAETYKLGASGGYDYMAFDPLSHLLYIAQGEQVVVFDAASGSVHGTLRGLKHTHGIVFDKDGRTGYVSDGGANEIVLFNRKDLKRLGAIPAGENPDGMVIEPTTGHLFVFNGRSKNLTVIDLVARKAVATVALTGKPEFPTADGAGHVFVNIEDKHQVIRLNAGTNTIEATWTLAGCESPTGMAIDAPASRIFPVCDNAKMPVVDAISGKIISLVPIGTGPDAVAYDAGRHLLFSSNGDAGTLSVVRQDSADRYTPLATVKTAAKGRTLALEAQSGDVYVIAPEPGAAGSSAPLVLLKISK